MISETLGKRLMYLRKDLGQRLGEDLSINDAAQKMGLERHTLSRLENGTKGTIDSLVTVLRYYRKQGYNQEWILEENNENTPMIVPSRTAIMSIVSTLNKIRECVSDHSEELEKQLREVGLNAPVAQSFPKDINPELVLPPNV